MKFARFSALVSLLAVCALGAWAQSTASLSGTVTDPSGAVVPNAQVTVHSLGTGANRVVKTDSDGIYVVPSLQPGDKRSRPPPRDSARTPCLRSRWMSTGRLR